MDIAKATARITNSDGFRKAVLRSTKVTAPVSKLGHKFGPEALTGIGIAGGLGTVILASRATLKLEDIVDTTRALIETAPDSKTAAKYKRDGLLAIAKLYAPSATLGLASAAAVLGAHGVLKKRNAALAAAYKALEMTYENYRKRVIEEYGEDKDYEFRRGLVEETHTVKGEKKQQFKQNPTGFSDYARFFDELNSNWTKTPEYNLMFLRIQQNWANDMLRARGYLFLNEVYKAIGIDQSQAGQVVGWYYDPNNGEGDNYVDFGIYDPDKQKAREFVNGQERSIFLDFNVDGEILSRLT